jgi:hypothetical protein
MSARPSSMSSASAASSAEIRVTAYDWDALAGELDTFGCAVLPKLLSAEECRSIAELYPDESHFRSHIHMARHGFGKGEYRYFKYPLPDLLGGLRTALYPRLADVANEWNARMGIDRRYPGNHAAFLKQCHDAGRRARRRYCCSMFQATSTASTRTCTAISPSRSRLRSFSPRRASTLPAASSS